MPSKDHILTIPYIAGFSESIQRVCRVFDIKTAFKSGKTLRSHLTKVKDTIPITTESFIVYSIHCSCRKVYIDETTRRLEQRVKEHQDACKRGDEKVSAIADNSCETLVFQAQKVTANGYYSIENHSNVISKLRRFGGC